MSPYADTIDAVHAGAARLTDFADCLIWMVKRRQRQSLDRRAQRQCKCNSKSKRSGHHVSPGWKAGARCAVAKTVLPFRNRATQKTPGTLITRKFFGAAPFWSGIVLAAHGASGGHEPFAQLQLPRVELWRAETSECRQKAGLYGYGFATKATTEGVSLPFLTIVPASPDSQDRRSMISEIIKYLREISQTCVSLARACPHRATALGLEEVAADMMAKAKELEELELE